MTKWRKAADNAEFAALTNDAGLFITGKKDEMDQLLEYLTALTSERDEAIRVAGELRAALHDRHGYCCRCGAFSGWDRVQQIQGTEKHEAFCPASLTASTGGSSDEPQKEIRE